jgi:hypothetical protein
MTKSHVIEELPELVLSQEEKISLPGPITLVKQAWFLCRGRLSTLLGIMLIPGLVNTGIKLLDTQGLIVTVILQVASTLIIMLAGLALIYAIKDSEEKIDILESYERGWTKILSNIWVAILVAFFTFGGFLLFFVPGIIFSVWFSFAAMMVITENMKGMNVLLKSKEYVRGKWFPIFWRIVFIGVISAFLFIPLGIFSDTTNISYLSEFVNFLILLILTPFATAYHFSLYTAVKTIKGDFVFTPNEKDRDILVGVATLGILIIPATISILSTMR